MIHPTRRSLRITLLATATLGLIGAAVAQDIPEGQSCGGLVCDLGLFGHKVPKAAPAPTPVPAPATAQLSTAPTRREPAAEPRRAAGIHHKTRVAKASVGSPAAERPASVAPVLGAPPVAAVLAPPPAKVAPAPVAALPPTPGPETAVPVVAVPVVAVPAVSAKVSKKAPPAGGPSPIDAVLGPQPVATSMVPEGVPVAPPPPPEEPVVLANPYASASPLRPRFQSVDPSVR